MRAAPRRARARTSRSTQRPRARRSSTSSRVCSIRRSYWTPDGHAVTHAMQPRQRSKCSATWSVSCDRAVVERRPSGGCARAASPSPRARARRSGSSAGRTRSARSRRSAPGPHRLHDALGERAPCARRGVRGVGDARARAHQRRLLAGLPAPATGQRRLQRADLRPAVASSPPSAAQLRVDGALASPRTSTCSGRPRGRRRSARAASGAAPASASASMRDGARARRQRVQPQRDPLDRAEPPARAAEQLAEVVAGDVLDDLAARARARAVARAPSSRRSRGRASCRSGGAAGRRGPRAGTRRSSASPGGSSDRRWPCSATQALEHRRAPSTPARSPSGRRARTRSAAAQTRSIESRALERVGAVGARHLAAQPRRREDLARVGEAARVEARGAAAPSRRGRPR